MTDKTTRNYEEPANELQKIYKNAVNKFLSLHKQDLKSGTETKLLEQAKTFEGMILGAGYIENQELLSTIFSYGKGLFNILDGGPGNDMNIQQLSAKKNLTDIYEYVGHLFPEVFRTEDYPKHVSSVSPELTAARFGNWEILAISETKFGRKIYDMKPIAHALVYETGSKDIQTPFSLNLKKAISIEKLAQQGIKVDYSQKKSGFPLMHSFIHEYRKNTKDNETILKTLIKNAPEVINEKMEVSTLPDKPQMDIFEYGAMVALKTTHAADFMATLVKVTPAELLPAGWQKTAMIDKFSKLSAERNFSSII